MRIFRHYSELPEDARGCAVALGNFDGVHIGHRAVIAESGRVAKALGARHAVMTFEPHPRSFFRPDQPPYRLTPFRIKAHQIAALGVDDLYNIHFDETFSRRSAKDFVSTVLVAGLGARHVVTGYDYVFGHNRGGDAALMAVMAERHGFGYTRVGPVEASPGEPYSSTRIRDHLMAGRPERAAALLGRPWEIEGRIEHGEHIGRALGFPTANIPLGEYLRPAIGIYAVRAGIDEGEATIWRDGVANLGRRPTFGGTDIMLEVHLFDFEGDIYGRHLRVRLLSFIRPEKKFDDIGRLRAQIAEDCAMARRLLAAADTERPVAAADAINP